MKYFKSFLRPLFVKGAANLLLYRFQQFMNLHRGNGDMLRWITRFQLSVQRMQEAWYDTYPPITDPNNAEVRDFVAGLPADEQAGLTNEEAMERANERPRVCMHSDHGQPCGPHLCLSLSDLIQDQRQVLTSWMAHRNRVLADYRLNELREVYLEIFCTTKNSVDNPLLTPSGHGGRKAFLVIEEGYLDNPGGYWVEDEEEEDASSRRGKADQTSPTAPPTPGKQMDSGMMIPGKTHLGMTGHGTIPRSPMPPRAKERKVRKAKEKSKYGKDGKDGK